MKMMEHSTLRDFFRDLSKPGQAFLMIQVLSEQWQQDSAAWDRATALIIEGVPYPLVLWQFSTHKFKNCLTGHPTPDATIIALVECEEPERHLRIGAMVHAE
jgi:hypothetical protein